MSTFLRPVIVGQVSFVRPQHTGIPSAQPAGRIHSAGDGNKFHVSRWLGLPIVKR